MIEDKRTADDEMGVEREETIRWYNITSNPDYDETILKDASDIVDRFIEAQQKPDMLKDLVIGMDADYDRLNFARGVIWAMTTVLGWKQRAAAGYQEIMEQDSIESKPEEEDETEPVWADR